MGIGEQRAAAGAGHPLTDHDPRGHRFTRGCLIALLLAPAGWLAAVVVLAVIVVVFVALLVLAASPAR